MSSKTDQRDEARDAAAGIQAGDETGAWQPGQEGSPATVDLPSAPAISDASPADATGEWKSAQQTPSLIAPVPDADGTRAYVPDPHSAQADAGAATANFVPGRVDRPARKKKEPDQQPVADGTTDFVPEGPTRDGMGQTRDGASSFHGHITSWRGTHSLTRQVLAKQKERGEATGDAQGRNPEAPDLATGRYLLQKFHARGGMGEIWLT